MAETKKVCSKCGESKSLSEYHRDANTKTGRRYWCKKCVCAHVRPLQRLNYKRNKKRYMAYAKAYYASHLEYFKAYGKAYRKRKKAEKDAR